MLSDGTLKRIASDIPKSDRGSLQGMMDYLSEHPDLVEKISQSEREKKKDLNLSSYDYNSLKSTIRPQTIWVIQLETMGAVDPSGRQVDEASRIPAGSKPAFCIYCYDEKGSFRSTSDCVGLPTSEFVLQAIQTAISHPLPPLKSCLPQMMMISQKLTQHREFLKSFLDSLPSPFEWRIETEEEAENVATGVDQMNKDGVVVGLKRAADLKAKGNKSFSKKQRSNAIDAYSQAIKELVHALSQKPSETQQAEARKQQAICYGNRAASYLLPGEGMDPTKALQDGKMATELDPTYVKGFHRQSVAHQALGQSLQAKEIITTALRRPELMNESALVDRLLDLLTEGKGLSNNEAELKQWTIDIMINDQGTGRLLSGLKGEWRSRIDKQFAQVSK